MYKQDLALDNLQWLRCHKTQPSTFSEELKAQVEHDFFVSNVSPQRINLFLIFKFLEPLGHLTKIIQSQPSSQIDLMVIISQLN